MQWTTEQRRAIDEGGSNILVSAGAGSGKTAVLTERVIKKLLNGDSLKDLIILTFTNAAAASMKKKIKEAIQKRNDEKLRKELEYLDQANIMTFDAFTLSLVKQYSYLLNITPDICILSNTELDIIYQDLLNETFNEFYGKEKFDKLLDTYTVRNTDLLASSLLDIYKRYLVNMVDPFDYLKNYFCKYGVEAFNTTYDEYLDSFVNEKNVILEDLKKLGEIDYLDSVYSDILVASKGLIEASSAQEIKNIGKINFPRPPRNNAGYTPEVKEMRERYLKEVKDFLNQKIKSEEESKLDYFDTKESVEVIIEVLIAFMYKYKTYTMKHNCFSFSDIALLAIKLLTENKDIENKIKCSTKEILVDEYQDTSDIQETLISILANNNCYMVGDVKQSIYRFRNANPDIFRCKFDDYGQNKGGKRIDLTKNFRSRREVLAEINDLFNDMMTRDFGGIEYRNGHKLEYGSKEYKGDIKNGIEYHLLGDFPPYREEDKKGRISNEFCLVLQDIMDKVVREKAKYSDFAILTRNKGNYNLYRELLKKYDIPHIIESNNQFIKNDEILVLISILSYLKDETDRLAYYSILRSFLFEETDNYLLENNSNHFAKEICDKIRKRIPYITLKELFQMIYDEFAIYEKIRKLPNPEAAEYRLLFMLSKTEVFMKLDYDFLKLIDYLNYLKKQSVGEGKMDIEFAEYQHEQNNALSLMTIHKSKGLEFKYCYLLETNANLLSRKQIGEDYPIKFDNKYGFVIYNKKLEKSYLERLIKINNEKETIYEEMRMLYVALTRAKEKALVFTYQMENGNRTLRPIGYATKQKYACYFDMFNSAYETVNFERNAEYELKEAKTSENLRGTRLTFKTISSNYEEKDEKTISSAISKLITKEEKSNLIYGTNIHQILEDFDFLNPDFSNLTINEKKIIEQLLKLDLFKKKIIKTYKEHEFIYNNQNGIIDLILETSDEMIIIDYKSSNIDKKEYDLQVETYVSYLKTRTKKRVSGYLYSLQQGKWKVVVE